MHGVGKFVSIGLVNDELGTEIKPTLKRCVRERVRVRERERGREGGREEKERLAGREGEQG